MTSRSDRLCAADAPGKSLDRRDGECRSRGSPQSRGDSDGRGARERPASGGTTVAITGMNFVAGATVIFGGMAATGVNVVSSTNIIATAPTHAGGTVTVTNSDGRAQRLPAD